MTAETFLKARYPGLLVEELLRAYREVESNFALSKWKTAALDAGHFVEAARRILEDVLFGAHTPLGVAISKFNEGELRKYEQAAGDESFRMIIPRVLFSVYTVRNKRGVAHVGAVSPNALDAALTLYSIKWVLAELVRLAAGIATTESQRLVDQLVERQLSILWKLGNTTRILDSGMTARDQALVLLYDSSPQTVAALQNAIEYKNGTKFRVLLRMLHDKRFIEVAADGLCTITPKGSLKAEQVVLDSDMTPGTT